MNATKLGAVDYLAKPVDADDVAAALLARDNKKVQPPENPMTNSFRDIGGAMVKSGIPADHFYFA